ncbi:glycosyltransferase [uncultured Polaribacter sp.]|uniref:glycosyltransferase n=1 Tax=uncultured Polaribacter sp. TaxID=174711 RepID=UPI002601B255|nr:glycosyltransferase [uncultured Polaribacter sp.]
MKTLSKNILILSPFFFPEPISTGKFNTNFALELRDKGHSVTILCFHPFYPDWKSKKSNNQLKGIKIIRGGKNLFYSKKTIFRRFVLEIGYAFFVLRKLFKYKNKIDIVVPVFPPSFAFFSVISFLKSIKKVGMVHDLQEIYSSTKKGVFNKFITYFINKIEKKCFKNCDRLIFLSNEMKDVANELYNLDETKLEVQYPFHSIKNKITNDLENILSSETINIVYSGALGDKQNPEKLYNFFDYSSKKTKNLKFYFFSQGTIFNNLKDKNKNQDINFYDLVNRENLEELYHRSSVQIVPQKEKTSKGSLPSKLPNLLITGCKILVITDRNSEIETLFRTNNLYSVTNSWNNEVLLTTLKELIDKDLDIAHQIEVSKDLFTIDKMIDKILY